MGDHPIHVDLDSSVVDWAIEHPESIAIFERFGVDCSCAGKSLEYACQQRGINPQMVIEELRRAIL